MRWIEAKVFFEADEPYWAMEMIAEIFRNLATQGIVIEDPTVDPHEGWDFEARKLPEHFAVMGYFPENRQGELKCQLLDKKIVDLSEKYHFSTRTVYQIINEQDWANSWKKYFKPQKIGKQMVVKPTWYNYCPKPNEIVLEIDPGMAFGTGTHATTAMCVRMLEQYLKKDDVFLDVGTGSGILMMAAHRLGAARITGIDRDETAVEVARQNLLRNNVPVEKFSLIVADLVDGLRGKYHVVAANILSETIVLLLDKLSELLFPKSLFIASGIVEQNKDLVFQKMSAKGFNVMDTQYCDQWVAIVAQK